MAERRNSKDTTVDRAEQVRKVGQEVRSWESQPSQPAPPAHLTHHIEGEEGPESRVGGHSLDLHEGLQLNCGIGGMKCGHGCGTQPHLECHGHGLRELAGHLGEWRRREGGVHLGAKSGWLSVHRASDADQATDHTQLGHRGVSPSGPCPQGHPA